MPLLKRSAFQLFRPPADLKPEELVFHVRFTKEIFRDYREYLHRINLYRQKVWTCKVSGKQNLTYEQALISESKATEKVQQFPKEFMGPVLNMVQFSVLGIHELVDKIYKTFKDRHVEGEIVVGKHGDTVLQCKILKLLDSDDNSEDCRLKYEVCWLSESGKRMDVCQENAENLSRRRYPLTKGLLKAFIRESAFAGLTRNSPWLVHDKLARKFKLDMEPSEELRRTFLGQNFGSIEPAESVQKPVQIMPGNAGLSFIKRKDLSASIQDENLGNGENIIHKKRKKDGGSLKTKGGNQGPIDIHKMNKKIRIDAKPGEKVKNEQPELAAEKKQLSVKSNTKKVKKVDSILKSKTIKPKKEVPLPIPKPPPSPPIRYPIDDLLVEPSPGDPPFTERPIPSTDFVLPMECIGDLLMVWDFCISFGKAIHLAPFMLEDFEKGLCYKDGEVPLLVEIHYALLGAAYSDPWMLQDFLQKRKRKSEMSIKTWKDDVCDILDIEGSEKLKSIAAVIRKTSYKQLQPLSKLEILHELVDRVLCSTVVRDQLGEIIDEHQAIAARKRELLLGPNKKKKDEKETCEGGSVGPHDGQPFLQDGEGQVERVGTGNKDMSMQIKDVVKEGDTHAKNEECEERSYKQETSEHVEDSEKEKVSVQQKKSQEKQKDLADHLSHEFQEQAFEKQKKSEQFEREMEKRSIRTNPLGKDREFNQYWFFNKEGRIFIESKDSSTWSYFGAKEEMDALLGSLNTKGIRERALKRHLEKHYSRISAALQKRSKDISLKFSMEEASLRRSQRVKSVPKPAGFLSYTNKYRNM